MESLESGMVTLASGIVIFDEKMKMKMKKFTILNGNCKFQNPEGFEKAVSFPY